MAAIAIHIRWVYKVEGSRTIITGYYFQRIAILYHYIFQASIEAQRVHMRASLRCKENAVEFII